MGNDSRISIKLIFLKIKNNIHKKPPQCGGFLLGQK